MGKILKRYKMTKYDKICFKCGTEFTSFRKARKFCDVCKDDNNHTLFKRNKSPIQGINDKWIKASDL